MDLLALIFQIKAVEQHSPILIRPILSMNYGRFLMEIYFPDPHDQLKFLHYELLKNDGSYFEAFELQLISCCCFIFLTSWFKTSPSQTARFQTTTRRKSLRICGNWACEVPQLSHHCQSLEIWKGAR